VRTPPAVMAAAPPPEVDHVPPPGEVVRVNDEFTQTEPVPPIGAGVGLTDSTAVVEQPSASVKVMVVVPGPEAPVTTPEVEPTVATVVLLLAQVPVPEPSVNTAIDPWQIVEPPKAYVIDPGDAGVGTTVLAVLGLEQPPVLPIELMVIVVPPESADVVKVPTPPVMVTEALPVPIVTPLRV